MLFSVANKMNLKRPTQLIFVALHRWSEKKCKDKKKSEKMPGIEIQKLRIYYIAIQRIGICVDRCTHDMSLMERYYFRTRGPPLFSCLLLSSSPIPVFSLVLGLDIVLIPSVGFGVLEVGVCLLGFCGRILKQGSSHSAPVSENVLRALWLAFGHLSRR